MYENLIRSLMIGNITSLQQLDIKDVSYNQVYHLRKQYVPGLESVKCSNCTGAVRKKTVFELPYCLLDCRVLDLIGTGFTTFPSMLVEGDGSGREYTDISWSRS